MTPGRARALKYGLGVAVLAALAGGGWWAWQGKSWPDFVPAVSALRSNVTAAAKDSKPEAKGDTSSNRRAGGPVAVEVAEARSSASTNDIQAIGSMQSDESVVLAPEVSGRISEIAVDEGKPVKTGAVLIKLDDALAAAEVADAKARLTLADANNDRARTLAKTGNVTGRVRDESIANYETAQAALALAETKLSKMTLRAPFDGIAGLRSVSAGAFVTAGAPIINLEKIDTLKVDFKVPETYLQDIKVGQAIQLSADAIPNRMFEGEIYAINPLVDVNGRALQIRARLANQEQLLRPGLFARIVIKGLKQRNVVIVPEAAVMPRGEEAFVFCVVDGKAVEKRVKLGQRVKAEVEILDGLDANAVVVVAGQQKLRNNSTLEILSSAPARPQTGVNDGLAPATPNRRS